MEEKRQKYIRGVGSVERVHIKHLLGAISGQYDDVLKTKGQDPEELRREFWGRFGFESNKLKKIGDALCWDGNCKYCGYECDCEYSQGGIASFDGCIKTFLNSPARFPIRSNDDCDRVSLRSLDIVEFLNKYGGRQLFSLAEIAGCWHAIIQCPDLL